jgi:hypothetical protein
MPSRRRIFYKEKEAENLTMLYVFLRSVEGSPEGCRKKSNPDLPYSRPTPHPGFLLLYGKRFTMVAATDSALAYVAHGYGLITILFPVLRIQIRRICILLGLLDQERIRYGSESFYHQAKIVLFCDLFETFYLLMMMYM